MDLSNLTPAQQRVVEAVLCNNEASSDEELVAYFQEEIGLTEEQALEAIAERDDMLKGDL